MKYSRKIRKESFAKVFELLCRESWEDLTLPKSDHCGLQDSSWEQRSVWFHLLNRHWGPKDVGNNSDMQNSAMHNISSDDVYFFQRRSWYFADDESKLIFRVPGEEKKMHKLN